MSVLPAKLHSTDHPNKCTPAVACLFGAALVVQLCGIVTTCLGLYGGQTGHIGKFTFDPQGPIPLYLIISGCGGVLGGALIVGCVSFKRDICKFAASIRDLCSNSDGEEPKQA